jgi:hypothetical protein
MLDLPNKFELPRSNVKRRVFILQGTELDVLVFLRVPESQFGRLIEAAGDMRHVSQKTRVLQRF